MLLTGGAIERISSRARDLGIERLRLRNGAAVCNSNTLTYVLLNLHPLQVSASVIK